MLDAMLKLNRKKNYKMKLCNFERVDASKTINKFTNDDDDTA